MLSVFTPHTRAPIATATEPATTKAISNEQKKTADVKNGITHIILSVTTQEGAVMREFEPNPRRCHFPASGLVPKGGYQNNPDGDGRSGRGGGNSVVTAVVLGGYDADGGAQRGWRWRGGVAGMSKQNPRCAATVTARGMHTVRGQRGRPWR